MSSNVSEFIFRPVIKLSVFKFIHIRDIFKEIISNIFQNGSMNAKLLEKLIKWSILCLYNALIRYLHYSSTWLHVTQYPDTQVNYVNRRIGCIPAGTKDASVSDFEKLLKQLVKEGKKSYKEKVTSIMCFKIWKTSRNMLLQTKWLNNKTLMTT